MRIREPRTRTWRRSLSALAVVTAVAVSVIYLPQPLLTDLAAAFHASPQSAGIVATAVQLGYAAGIFFLVPLADRIQPRRQITTQLALLAAALTASAFLPSLASVAVGFAAVGLVANIAQLVIPVAGRLAPDDRKHATTSVLVSSLLIGIFGGRILAGLLASAIGWRGVTLLFAALVLAMIPVVRAVIPGQLASTSRARYPQLLWSTVRRFGTNSALRQSSIMQFFGFALFNSIWTVMVLHLTAAPFHWTVAAAGLFGLVGLAAGAVTPFAGQWMQRYGSTRVTGVFLALLVAATLSIVFDSKVVWLFGISIFFLTWANQVLQAANQSRSLQAAPDGPAQANTVFMVSVFFGGALGGALGPIAYGAGGMRAAAIQGLVFAAVFLAVWLRASVRTSGSGITGRR